MSERTFPKVAPNARTTAKVPYVDRAGCEMVSVVLKNPSRADACRADSTVQRVEAYIWRRFATCSSLRILNLFAYRATRAPDLWQRVGGNLNNAVGPSNDHFLRDSFQKSTYIVGAWGQATKASPGTRDLYRCRVDQVVALLRPHAEKLRQVTPSRGPTSDRNYFPLHGLRWNSKRICKSTLTEWCPFEDGGRY